MEPCAPGTEDDPPIMYSTLNKQENEQERLLSLKAFLRNGKYENVFELSYLNGSEHWYCKACECPVMGRVFQHEAGRRHSVNISNTHHNKENFKRGPSPEEPATVEVAPGEPLPPGFEEISRVSQIQERLNGFKLGPLVALEYLLELQDDDTTKESVYLCILCDKKGDPRTVLTHLASYNHISQYLQKHFPTCWRALAPYNTKQYRRNWQTALQKIAEGIEKKFGRLNPYPIDKDRFEKDRMHFLQIIGKGRHFSENTGYTFEELVVHDELIKTHEEDKSYESTTNNNWGNIATIQKPFKKRSPSPPVVGVPSKRNKGNAQTNPRKAQNQEPAYVVQAKQAQLNQPNKPLASTTQQPPQQDALGRAPPGQFARQPLDRQPPPGRSQGRRRSLSSVSSLSDRSDGSDDDRRRMKRDNDRPPLQRGRPQFDRDRQLPYGRRRSPSPRRRSPFRRRSPSPRRRVSPKRRSKSPVAKRRSPSPTEQEKEKLRKIEEFRKLARAIENDMQKTLKQHEKNPEKHPQYNEEWKKFWNKRYKELKAEGVDVQKHDFKPEWIEFWNKRMVEIHSDELRNRKEALRKRLSPPEELNPIKFKIGATLSLPDKISSKPLPMAAQPDQDNEIIVIDDKDDVVVTKKGNNPWEDKNKGGPSRKPTIKRSLSPKREKSPLTRYVKQRSRSRERSFRRSTSKERVRGKNASPSSEVSRTSRPFKRSRSRERLSGRRSRSRSISREKTSAKRSVSGDRIITSRIKNASPISIISNVSRSNKGRSYRDSRERSLSRNRSHSRGRAISPYSRRSKERRSVSRERSWERRDSDRKRQSEFIRESSFERDLRAKERVRTIADLPWEKRDMLPVYRNPYLPPAVMRDVTRKPVDMSGPVLPDDDIEEMEVNVVDVLRLLTALEERLGSLGPKVIDLLAQALALEKKEANSCESLLDNDINCVLFETVKEKLKGQLFAGLVDMVQERAFKRAIKKIASLMHMAGQRKRQRDKLLPKASPVTVAGVGAVDKAAIARQIANALVAQGKTDVSQAELETLINAVVGMAEASKNSSKPMTTANFLQLFGAGNMEKEKIIIPSSVKKSDLVDLEKLTEPLTPSPGKNSANNMENLSDSDLQTLLQNFKDLSTEEQHNLINYLKKLEYQEPERVERLRKFVNLESKSKDEDKYEDEDANDSGKKNKNKVGSPFSNRSGAINPDYSLVDIDSEEDNENDEKKDNKEEKSETEQAEKKVHVDSEDEYSFEDVVKSVSKNVKDKEIEHSKKVLEETMKYDKSKSEVNISSAKDLISNLMANITKSNSSSTSVDLLGLGAKPLLSNPPTTMANVDLTKLGNINMSSLASIVSNFKNITSPGAVENKLDFQPPSSPGKNANKLNFDLTSLKTQTQEKLGHRDPNLNKGGPLVLNLLDRDRSFSGPGPDRGLNRFENPDMGQGGPRENLGFDRPRFGDPDRFGPGGPDRFGPGGPDRFGTGGPDRFGPGGPDRFSSGGPDRFGPVGPDRIGPGGPDRFGPGGPDRFVPSGQDRFGPGGPDRFGPSGQDRFGVGGPDRFGGSDRFMGDRFGGFGGPDRRFNGSDRFGAPDRGFGGPDRGFGPDRESGPIDKIPGLLDRVAAAPGRVPNFLDKGPSNPLDRGVGGPRMGPGPGPGPDRMRGTISSGPFRVAQNSGIDSNNSGMFGNRGGLPFGTDAGPMSGQPRPGQNDQNQFSRLPAPDFNRPPGNSFNRW